MLQVTRTFYFIKQQCTAAEDRKDSTNIKISNHVSFNYNLKITNKQQVYNEIKYLKKLIDKPI